jgi:hypothetical protein
MAVEFSRVDHSRCRTARRKKTATAFEIMASGGAVGRLGLIFPSTLLASTDDLQTQIQHRAHRDAEYTENKSGPGDIRPSQTSTGSAIKRHPRIRAPAHRSIQSPRAPQLLLLRRAPARRLRAPWATRRPVRVTPQSHARPQLTRAKPRTDPKRAYTYYSVRVKRDPPLQFGAGRYLSITDVSTKFAVNLN